MCVLFVVSYFHARVIPSGLNPAQFQQGSPACGLSYYFLNLLFRLF